MDILHKKAVAEAELALTSMTGEVPSKGAEVFSTVPSYVLRDFLKISKEYAELKGWADHMSIHEQQVFKDRKILVDNWEEKMSEDIYPDESEGYYENQCLDNCVCEECLVGRAQYEAENKIANQRERWESDQEEIPKGKKI